MSRDARIDAYIDKSAEFARPILRELRERVHAACPQATESIKWGMPFFELDGKPLCNMAAFKQHVSFGFWQHARIFGGAERDGMGSYGRIGSLQDLPAKKTMFADFRKAIAARSDAAEKPAPRKPAAPKPALEAPPEFVAALQRNAAAQAAFDAFPPGARREYVEWIVEAKRADTREKRIAQAVEWIAEGKRRNWKYER